MSELKYKACQQVIFNYGGEELEGVIDFGLSGVPSAEESVYDISAHDGTITFHVNESDIVRAVTEAEPSDFATVAE